MAVINIVRVRNHLSISQLEFTVRVSRYVDISENTGQYASGEYTVWVPRHIVTDTERLKQYIERCLIDKNLNKMVEQITNLTWNADV